MLDVFRNVTLAIALHVVVPEIDLACAFVIAVDGIM